MQKLLNNVILYSKNTNLRFSLDNRECYVNDAKLSDYRGINVTWEIYQITDKMQYLSDFFEYDEAINVRVHLNILGFPNLDGIYVFMIGRKKIDFNTLNKFQMIHDSRSFEVITTMKNIGSKRVRRHFAPIKIFNGAKRGESHRTGKLYLLVDQEEVSGDAVEFLSLLKEAEIRNFETVFRVIEETHRRIIYYMIFFIVTLISVMFGQVKVVSWMVTAVGLLMLSQSFYNLFFRIISVNLRTFFSNNSSIVQKFLFRFVCVYYIYYSVIFGVIYINKLTVYPLLILVIMLVSPVSAMFFLKRALELNGIFSEKRQRELYKKATKRRKKILLLLVLSLIPLSLLLLLVSSLLIPLGQELLQQKQG